MIEKKFIVEYNELTDLFPEDMYDEVLEFVVSDDGSGYIIIDTDLKEWKDDETMTTIINYLIENGVPENEEVYVLG